ncbi:MAG TPA: Holliday junction branch migration protein RuvA [Candidatus Dojkabacteria bacterium]|nr:Holliday junction branch migration protein RuvA [Candidatus Dojkabacteria bacterium]
MISYISGKVLKNNIGKNNYVDVLLPSGIAYRVFVTSMFNFVQVGSQISVYTSFQVREDSQTLYGFATQEERDFFEELLTVSGIGPKSALSILSTYSMDRVKKIILDGDSVLLSKTPGLGLKGAQKVILELRGRIDFEKDDLQMKENVKLGELKDALKSLGFAGKDLKDGIKRGEEVLKEGDVDIEILIKKVLQD